MHDVDFDPAAGLPADLVEAATYRRGRIGLFDGVDPPRTALMVIDMQRAWIAPAAPFETPPARAIVPRINAIAAALRAAGGLVVWVQHTAGAAGTPEAWSLYFDNFIAAADRPAVVAALTPGSPFHDLDPSLDVRDGDVRLRKYRFSAFARNPHDPEAMLRDRGIDTLIVTGTATNMCCESTVRDGMMRDFRLFMPHDAVAAPRPDGHRAGIRSVMQGFADVRPTATLLALIAAAGGRSPA